MASVPRCPGSVRRDRLKAGDLGKCASGVPSTRVPCGVTRENARPSRTNRSNPSSRSSALRARLIAGCDVPKRRPPGSRTPVMGDRHGILQLMKFTLRPTAMNGVSNWRAVIITICNQWMALSLFAIDQLARHRVSPRPKLRVRPPMILRQHPRHDRPHAVVRINRLAPEHVTMYVKVEAFNPVGSVKDRLALGIIEDAERAASSSPGQTVSRRPPATPASRWRWCARPRLSVRRGHGRDLLGRAPQDHALPRRAR